MSSKFSLTVEYNSLVKLGKINFDPFQKETLEKLNVLKQYSIKNCWPYWDKFDQRVEYDKPSLARDGQHYGIEHHKRFAELFLENFGRKLR